MTANINQLQYLNGAQAYQLINGQTASDEETLLMQQYMQNQPQMMGANSDDDGKLGFFDMVGSAIKGAGKAVVNFVSNPLNLAMAAGCIALCCIPVVGPVIGLGMAAAGVMSGVGKVGEGLALASQAQTDEQARAAFENVGAGALQTGLSVVGAKASFGAVKGAGLTNGMSKTNAVLHPIKSAKQFVNNTGNALKNEGSFTSTALYETGKAFKNAEGGLISKSGEALKTAKNQVLDKTEFGALYKKETVSEGIKADSVIGKFDRAGGAALKYAKTKYSQGKDAITQRQQARAAAKDPEAYVKKADDDLTTFTSAKTWKPDGTGKFVNSKGETITMAEYTKMRNEMITAKDASKTTANYVNAGKNKAEIAKLEGELSAATKAGDKAKIAKLEKELDTVKFYAEKFEKDSGVSLGTASKVDQLAYRNAATGRTSLLRQGLADYKDGVTAVGYTSKTGATPAFGYLTPNANSQDDLMRTYYGY